MKNSSRTNDPIVAELMSVVIVSYNTRDLLRKCLASVDEQHPRDIVVVDNASADGSADLVSHEFPRVELLRNQYNVGYGAAVNRGIEACTTPYVLVLNPDTIPQPHSLARLAMYLGQNPGVGIVGPKLIHLDGTLQASCYAFPTPFNLIVDFSNVARVLRRARLGTDHLLRTRAHRGPRAVPWVSGAAFAVRREAFDAIGGFDESFFMYFEEVDLCYRLLRACWQVHFAPSAEVIHIGAASTRQRRGEMATQFFASLSRFYALHYSTRLRAQMRLVVASIVLVRFVRDLMASVFTHDPVRKAQLAEDVATWKRLLTGYPHAATTT